MKVRIKFSKEGSLKFIGHLDTMRYFQKALRRAKLPVAYSEGFSPHIIMSFAAPVESSLFKVLQVSDRQRKSIRRTVGSRKIFITLSQ